MDVKGTCFSCALILALVILAFSSIFLGVERAWADSLIAIIHVGSFPGDIAVNPNSGNVYVVNRDFSSDSISVISSSNQVIATIPVGLAPSGIAVNPNTGNVYITNSLSSSVSVISPSNQVIATILVGTVPQSVAINSGIRT